MMTLTIEIPALDRLCNWLESRDKTDLLGAIENEIVQKIKEAAGRQRCWAPLMTAAKKLLEMSGTMMPMLRAVFIRSARASYPGGDAGCRTEGRGADAGRRQAEGRDGHVPGVRD